MMYLPQLTTLLQLAFVASSIFSSSSARRRRQIVFEEDEDRRDRSPESNCVTPDRQRGRCIQWRGCPPLRRINNWNRLQPYVCRFVGSEPLFCCPIEDDTEDPDVIFPTTSTRRPGRRTTRRTTTTRRPTTTTRRTTIATRRTTTTRRPTTTKRPNTDNLETKPRFLPNECGKIKFTKNRVIGGQEAERGGWPWMAVVMVQRSNNDKSPDCGATLVTNRHVVTAAHCIVTGRAAATIQASRLSIRLGAHDLRINNEPNAIDVNVDEVRRHELFDPRTYKNDIAVLRMSRSIQFSDTISPVCLPYDSLRNEDLTDKTATVTGFGTIAYNGPSSSVLMEVSFDIKSQEECRQAFVRELNITEVYLCAGTADGSKDACQGDSGGPLVTIGGQSRYYLVGVVSFGKLCAQPGYPGVYTRVTKYLDWLRTNLAN